MRRTIAITVLLVFFNAIILYASVPELKYVNEQGQYVTDDMLEKIAIEKRIIPQNAGEAFLQAEIKKKNTIAIWILIDHDTKVSVIDNFRQLEKQEGIIIRLPSEYYVKEITADIYNSIVKEGIVVMELRNVFKTVAIMEGDYDNGKDKVAFAKEYMGEEGFQLFQKMYPAKYAKLVDK